MSLLVLVSIAILCYCSTVFGFVDDLSNQNFDDYMMNGKPVLLEFYTPWCSHCKAFEQHFVVTARELSQHGFKVARIDANANVVTAVRFSVETVPSLYLYRDYKLWRYTGEMSIEALIEFCTKDYIYYQPIPFWTSPMGPLGLSRSCLMSISLLLLTIVTPIQNLFGVSEFACYVIMFFGIIGSILLVTVAIVWFSVAHVKED